MSYILYTYHVLLEFGVFHRISGPNSNTKMESKKTPQICQIGNNMDIMHIYIINYNYIRFLPITSFSIFSDFAAISTLHYCPATKKCSNTLKLMICINLKATKTTCYHPGDLVVTFSGNPEHPTPGGQFTQLPR